MVQLRHVLILVLAAAAMSAAERTVDPTFLKRQVRDIKPAMVYMATDTCEYRPLFGEGDEAAGIVRGVARFGEVTVKPGGACKDVSYALQEEVYVVMDGTGTLKYGSAESPVKKDDFLYVPGALPHALANTGSAPLRVMAMAFKLRDKESISGQGVIAANLNEVKKQTVGGHPDSVLYQLMMGDTRSTRDRIAAGRVLTSLYVMSFAPGGTNFPHHHDSEEEIYVLLDGRGDMVAGSGTDGVEARFPAKPGDAYFFRLNCTVGFYNSQDGPARILAVRSLYPRRN